MPRATVLVVEDESDIADSYERWLGDAHEVHRAETGEAALAKLDDVAVDVDVVLLDRMLPGISGGEVLAEIRDRGHACRVAMVSAVRPGIDVVEMGFDAYVTKPPGKEQLRETVERLLALSTLDEELQEYYSLVARRSALESELADGELAADADYRALVDRIETYRASLDASTPDLASDTEFVAAVREVDGGLPTGDEDLDPFGGTDPE